MVNELMTTTDVSAMLAIPIATLRWWRHAGTGPKSFKLGKSVRYERREVENWVRNQKEATTVGD